MQRHYIYLIIRVASPLNFSSIHRIACGVFLFRSFLFRYSLSHSFSFVILTDLATVTAFLGAIRAAKSAQMNKNTRCFTYRPTTPRHTHTPDT